jgi:alkylation response protein AidB-like acyl-CoA dehydrogenase
MSTTTSTPAIRPGSDQLTELLARIRAGAEEREREVKAPFEPIAWIKEAGLGRLRVPVEEGGGGASLRELFETLIALAEADSNVAHILRTHYWFVEQQLVSADPDARARGLALLNSGALVGNGFSEQSKKPVGLYFDTAFTPDPSGGYRLNGAKYYSTGTLYSDYTHLRSVRNDAVALAKRRARNFSHAAVPQSPSDDRQVLQVVGEIASNAFAAEAIVLIAAERLQDAYDSVVDGAPTHEAAEAAQLAAAEAKVAVDSFSYATAAKLFDVGGASATQSIYNLDRHWRNVRTISTHNPTFLKASAIGDNIANGVSFPANAYF